MGKLWISLALSVLACGPMGQPKQSWEKPPPAEGEGEGTKKSEPEPPPEPSTPKEASHEDVCRKMWSLIAKDAEAKAKKNPKAKVPNDDDRSGFLQDCYKSGKDESKANPEKYNCQRKCILESEELAEVEKCGKTCK